MLVSLLAAGVVFVTWRQAARFGLTLHNVSIYPPQTRSALFSRETFLLSGEFNAVLEPSARASSTYHSHLKRRSLEFIISKVLDFFKGGGEARISHILLEYSVTEL